MALINGLCKCHMPDTALSYLRQMEEREMIPDSFVYVTLLSTFLSDSNLPMAFEIFKEMINKGIIPDQLDKNYSVMKDGICELLMDIRTSSCVRALLSMEA